MLNDAMDLLLDYGLLHLIGWWLLLFFASWLLLWLACRLMSRKVNSSWARTLACITAFGGACFPAVVTTLGSVQDGVAVEVYPIDSKMVREVVRQHPRATPEERLIHLSNSQRKDGKHLEPTDTAKQIAKETFALEKNKGARELLYLPKYVRWQIGGKEDRALQQACRDLCTEAILRHYAGSELHNFTLGIAFAWVLWIFIPCLLIGMALSYIAIQNPPPRFKPSKYLTLEFPLHPKKD